MRTAPPASSAPASLWSDASFLSAPAAVSGGASARRTTGTAPSASRSEARSGIFQSVDLATKVIGRETSARTRIGSTSPFAWFATKRTGPDSGTFSRPAASMRL